MKSLENDSDPFLKRFRQVWSSGNRKQSLIRTQYEWSQGRLEGLCCVPVDSWCRLHCSQLLHKAHTYIKPSRIAANWKVFKCSGSYMIKVMILISEGACMCACSGLSDSLLHHGLWLTRLFSPWGSPGKILERVVISSSRGSSPPRDQTHGSCTSSWQADSLPTRQPGSPSEGAKPHRESCRRMI